MDERLANGNTLLKTGSLRMVTDSGRELKWSIPGRVTGQSQISAGGTNMQFLAGKAPSPSHVAVQRLPCLMIC